MLRVRFEEKAAAKSDDIGLPLGQGQSRSSALEIATDAANEG